MPAGRGHEIRRRGSHRLIDSGDAVGRQLNREAKTLAARQTLEPVGIGFRREIAPQPEQATAIARAAQISRIRSSATRPKRSTRIAIETLSIESRLTAERSGTGSSPGSRSTSLGRFRMLVVHGAMSAR